MNAQLVCCNAHLAREQMHYQLCRRSLALLERRSGT